MIIKTKADVRKFVEEIWDNLIYSHIISLGKVFGKRSQIILATQPHIIKMTQSGLLIEYLLDFSSLFALDAFCNPIEKQEDVIDEIWGEIEKHEKAI